MKTNKDLSLIKIIFSWLLAFLLMGAIFVLSAQGVDDSARISSSALNISASFVDNWQLSVFFLFIFVSLLVGIWLIRRTKSKNKILLFLLAYLIFCILAFLFLYFIFRPYYLSSNVQGYNYWTIHRFFRKYAHFFIYLLLGFLVKNALNYSGVYGVRSILTALGICTLYAIFDETHQYFVPGRTALFTDVFIDAVGSFIGIVIYTIFDLISRDRTIWQAFWNL